MRTKIYPPPPIHAATRFQHLPSDRLSDMLLPSFKKPFTLHIERYKGFAMGSGCANNELNYSAKKPREKRRRERTQRQRLMALGMPEEQVNQLNCKQVREHLKRPLAVQKKFATAKSA